MIDERLRQPRREHVERARLRVAEPRELHRLVAPDRLHELGARAIRVRGDLADERRRFERHAAVHEGTDDQQPLTGLQVEGDADRQLRVHPEVDLRTVSHG